MKRSNVIVVLLGLTTVLFAPSPQPTKDPVMDDLRRSVMELANRSAEEMRKSQRMRLSSRGIISGSSLDLVENLAKLVDLESEAVENSEAELAQERLKNKILIGVAMVLTVLLGVGFWCWRSRKIGPASQEELLFWKVFGYINLEHLYVVTETGLDAAHLGQYRKYCLKAINDQLTESSAISIRQSLLTARRSLRLAIGDNQPLKEKLAFIEFRLRALLDQLGAPKDKS